MSRAYLQCTEETCQRRQEIQKKTHDCDFCGGLLEVNYEFEGFDPEAVRHTWRQRRLSDAPADRSGVWRFRELLPFVEASNRIISLCEGSTPLVEAR
ncbi:MAG TPA: hypothetical protein VHM88_06825, partial [Candidatus Acidoferrales bacterium]|nr:hypothetical protein [Candidatus Acidoferrales bacterium]